MKIIQVISSLGNGGAEKLVVELSNQLAIANDVTIVSLKRVEDFMFPPKKITSKVNIIETNKRKGLDLQVLLQLVSILREKKPEIVHIHLNMALYYFLLLIPFFRRISFCYTIHNTFGPHENLFKKLNKLPFYRKITNICLSRSIYSDFNKAFPKLRFTTIENGLNEMKPTDLNESVRQEISLKNSNPRDKVFLFVGRFSYQKNIPLLLEIFSDRRLENSTLLIIGSGSFELTNQIERVCNKSKGRIIFLGSRDNIVDYMQYVDALILTSHHEGLPIVVLEALSLGLPVLSTPVGAMPDIIQDGVNGFLSKSIDINDMIDIIVRFCKLNKVELKVMEDNNIMLYNKEFSIESCARKYTDLFVNVNG